MYLKLETNVLGVRDATLPRATKTRLGLEFTIGNTMCSTSKQIPERAPERRASFTDAQINFLSRAHLWKSTDNQVSVSSNSSTYAITALTSSTAALPARTQIPEEWEHKPEPAVHSVEQKWICPWVPEGHCVSWSSLNFQRKCREMKVPRREIYHLKNVNAIICAFSGCQTPNIALYKWHSYTIDDPPFCVSRSWW